MPPATCLDDVKLRVSEALQEEEGLWSALQKRLQDHLSYEQADDYEPPILSATPSAPSKTRRLRWAYMESVFHYAAHRSLCQEDATADDIGTQFPLILVFEEASSIILAPSAVGKLVDWLRCASRPFVCSRLLVVVIAPRAASLRREVAAGFAASLVQHRVGFVEVRTVEQAAEYTLQCALAIAASRKRRIPSRFKIAGVKCQTLSRDPDDSLRRIWVSQLMQLPGVSEDIAKTISNRYSSPAALLKAVSSIAGSPAVGGATGDLFLADLEYPIRGKKETRKVGPVISRRIFTLFHPQASAQDKMV